MWQFPALCARVSLYAKPNDTTVYLCFCVALVYLVGFFFFFFSIAFIVPNRQKSVLIDKAGFSPVLFFYVLTNFIIYAWIETCSDYSLWAYNVCRVYVSHAENEHSWLEVVFLINAEMYEMCLIVEQLNRLLFLLQLKGRTTRNFILI